MKSIESDHFVRAVAILLVCAHHAGYPSIYLAGGLNVLMLMSGFHLAKFSFGQSRDVVLDRIEQLTLRLLAIALPVMTLWALLFWNFKPTEFLLISNWISIDRVSKFPVWYIQVFTQMMVVIWIVFRVTPMANLVKSKPIAVTSIILLFSVFINILCFQIWNTEYLRNQLPQLLIWNFVIGWVFWAFLENENELSPVYRKTILTLVSCVVYFVILYFGAHNGEGLTRFVVLTISTVTLIWFKEIPVPSVLYRFLIIVSQGILFIFVFHRGFYYVVWKLSNSAGIEPSTIPPILTFLFGVFGSIAIWVFIEALKRSIFLVNSKRAEGTA